MKNIIKINIVLLIVLLMNMVQVQAQTVIDNPQEEAASDCKTNIVEPEFIYTYPPDDDLGDPGDEEDDEDDENTDEEEFENKRRVMFVHGYQGDVSSWANASSFLSTRPKRDYIVQNKAYDTKNILNLQLISDQIKTENLNELENFPTKENKRNFFIAHSMGGMALRFMQNNYNDIDLPYGGIITVGSAHLGVYAADMKVFKTKKYKAFLHQTCQTHLAPKIMAVLPGFVHRLNALAGLFATNYLSDEVCKGAIAVGSELLLDELIDPNLTMQVLDTFYPKKLRVDHRLALYGVEEDEGVYTVSKKVISKNSNHNTGHDLTINVEGLILPKFAGSMIKKPNEYPTWKADESDDEGLKFWSEGILNYTANRDNLNLKISSIRYNLEHLGQKAENINLRNSYDRGIRWYRDANFQYLELIGGIQNIWVTQNKCECLLEEDGMGNTFSIHYDYTGDCSNLIDTYIDGYKVLYSNPYIMVEAQKFESDGFVLKNSASAMPGVKEAIRMQGSGHFQMRNDSNLEKEFDNMFRDNVYGKYWKLY